MALVQFLEYIHPEDVERHGGKTVNLSRLSNLGFCVPRGFSISTEAFIQMVKKKKKLIDLLRKVDETEDFEKILVGSALIQKIIDDYKIPEELVFEIMTCLDHLDRTDYGFAVRSSATVEDRSDISFAGQADSYLCMKDHKDIIQSVKRVWQSVFSERALIYLKTRGIPVFQVKMAVLVQEMIPAEISGVMFTANVVTSDFDEMLINSTWGLGDTLVSGKIVPDTYVLSKRPINVIQRNLGDKEFTSKLDIHSLAITDTPEEKRTEFTLDDHTLFEIAEVGMKIEMEMGSPQDIEWCLKPDSELVILQSRPITTLSEPSSRVE